MISPNMSFVFGLIAFLKPSVSLGFTNVVSTPKHVIFGELPKTSTGKIQKFELRKNAKEI